MSSQAAQWPQQLTLGVFLEASLCDLGLPLVPGCLDQRQQMSLNTMRPTSPNHLSTGQEDEKKTCL